MENAASDPSCTDPHGVIAFPSSAPTFPNCPIALLNESFTTLRAGSFASARASCHCAAMSKDRPSRSGGALFAFSIIGGTIAGVIAGEPSIGVVGGGLLGLALMLLVWLLDRR
jgi:hypothetical protein